MLLRTIISLFSKINYLIIFKDTLLESTGYLALTGWMTTCNECHDLLVWKLSYHQYSRLDILRTRKFILQSTTDLQSKIKTSHLSNMKQENVTIWLGCSVTNTYTKLQ
jgi:hypothetical protein